MSKVSPFNSFRSAVGKIILPSVLSLLLGVVALPASAAPAQNDPSGGQCDSLDPSSGLFSTCIQAHSARNRVEHLQSVGASATAIGMAQDELAEAIAMFSELQGGTIPGFYNIGDTGPAGGIVFYLFNDGGGLEAAPEDQGTYQWGCNGTVITGAGGTAIGDGAQNTSAILLANCSIPADAAAVADAYELNGFTDWFLPSRGELIEIYTSLLGIDSCGFRKF